MEVDMEEESELITDIPTSFSPDFNVPDSIRQAVAQRKVQPTFKTRVYLGGTLYSSDTKHVGNSNVLYSPRKQHGTMLPGRIRYIYSQGDQTFFGVTRLGEKGTTFIDPFAPYPDFPAKVFLSKFADNVEVVEGENLVCHFARWSLSSEHSVVLSLGKVGNVWAES